MSSPTHSVSDLLHGSTASAEGSTTLDASTFIDPFSESNPFAEDTLGGSAISSTLRTSQSLNFHEYYPQSTDAHTHHHHDDNDDDNDDHAAEGSGALQKSFSAINLAVGSPVEDTPFTAPILGGQETGGSGGHQRWSSVDSNTRYDSDEHQQITAYGQDSARSSDEAGHYRPASTRSLGSQVKKKIENIDDRLPCSNADLKQDTDTLGLLLDVVSAPSRKRSPSLVRNYGGRTPKDWRRHQPAYYLQSAHSGMSLENRKSTPPKQTADGEHETNGIATSLSNRQTLLLTSRMILQCRGDTGTFCGFTTS